MPDRARGEHGISRSAHRWVPGSMALTCLDLGTSVAVFISGLETSVPAQHIGRVLHREVQRARGGARGARRVWARGGRAGGGGMGGTHLQRQSRSRGEGEHNLPVVLGLSLPRQVPVQDAHGGVIC